MSNEFNLDCIKCRTTFDKLAGANVDKNNDGRIDENEKQGYIDFLGGLKSSGDLSEAEYNLEISVFNEAFGQTENQNVDAFKSNTAMTTPIVSETKGTRKQFNKDLKELYKANYGMMEAVERLAEKSYNDPGSAAMLAIVKEMIAFIQAKPITSKDDIKALKKQRNNFPSEYRKIFNTLIDKAEADLRTAHVSEMIQEYGALKAGAEQGTEINYSAFRDQAQASAAAKNGRKYTYKERKAFKNYVIDDALEGIYMDKMHNTTGHTGKAVTKELKLINGRDDKLEASAIKKAKSVLNVQGYLNKSKDRLNKISAVSSEEIIKGITNDASKGDNESRSKSALGEELFHKLERAYLSKHNNGNGTYDLTEIYNIVKYRIGADANANRSQDLRMAEMQHIKEDLEALGIPELSQKDVEHIIRLCGFHVEEKEHVAAVLPLTAGLANAIADAFVFAKSRDQLIQIPVSITNTINLDIAVILKQEGLLEGVELTTDVNGNLNAQVIQEIGPIIAEKLVTEPMRTIKAFSAAMGVANLLVALLPLIIGKEQSVEKSCISISDFDLDNEKYTNYNEYEKYVKEKYMKSPKKAGALLAITAMYTDENGKIDVGALSSALNRIAGVGSNLNCQELQRGSIEIQRRQEEKEDEVVISENCERVEVSIPETKIEKVEVPTINGRKSTWSLIAGSYPCLVQKYGLKKTIRMLKLVQAINDNDYSTERMEKLLNMSYNNVSALKEEQGFNYATYCSMLNATCLSSSVKVPDVLADCDRDKDKNLRARRSNIRLTRRGQARKPGQSESDYASVTRVRQESQDVCTYGARYNGETVYYPSQEARDNGVAEYRRNHPKSRVEKVTWDNFQQN